MRRVAPTVRQIVAPVLLALVLPACAVEPEAPSGDVPTEPVAVVRDIAVETTVAFTEGPTGMNPSSAVGALVSPATQPTPAISMIQPIPTRILIKSPPHVRTAPTSSQES